MQSLFGGGGGPARGSTPPRARALESPGCSRWCLRLIGLVVMWLHDSVERVGSHTDMPLASGREFSVGIYPASKAAQ